MLKANICQNERFFECPKLACIEWFGISRIVKLFIRKHSYFDEMPSCDNKRGDNTLGNGCPLTTRQTEAIFNFTMIYTFIPSRRMHILLRSTRSARVVLNSARNERME